MQNFIRDFGNRKCLPGYKREGRGEMHRIKAAVSIPERAFPKIGYSGFSILAAALFFLGCSRSGHHPDPIAPEIPRSPFDIEAGAILFSNKSPTTLSQGKVNRNRDIWIWWTIYNVGIEPIPSQAILLKVFINGRLSSYGFSNSRPVRPGSFFSAGRPGAFARYFEEAGRYEIKLKVRLPSKLGETNLDNNEITRYVDVVE